MKFLISFLFLPLAFANNKECGKFWSTLPATSRPNTYFPTLPGAPPPPSANPSTQPKPKWRTTLPEPQSQKAAPADTQTPNPNHNIIEFKSRHGDSKTKFEITGPDFGSGDTTIIKRATHLPTGKKGALRIPRTDHEDTHVNDYMSYYEKGMTQAKDLGVPAAEILLVEPSQDRFSGDPPRWLLVKEYNVKFNLGTYLLEGKKALKDGITHNQVVEAMKVFSEKAAKATQSGNIDVHPGNLVLVEENGELKFIILDISCGGMYGNLIKSTFTRDRMVHEEAFKVETKEREIFQSLANAAWESTMKVRFQPSLIEKTAPPNPLKWKAPDNN